ncbi:MAG TPA: hypothetical protein VMH28_32320 [Candidatus Acidoferrales bacterium]|nr:hypothetical protein [Candidatus Acidoferrales bacterium]
MDAAQKLFKHSVLIPALVFALCLSAPAWAQPSFVLSTNVVNLSGGATGADVNVTSSAAGTTEITFTAAVTSYDSGSGSSRWLNVSSGGTTPSAVALNLGNLAALPAGAHQAIVTLHATAPAGVSDVAITVNFTQGGSSATLSASPGTISVNLPSNSTTSTSTTISTSSAAVVSLNAPTVATTSCTNFNWLSSATLTSNAVSLGSPVTLNIVINTAGMSTATCSGSVTVSPTVGVALNIPVTLNVNGTGGSGSLTPSQSSVSLAFTTNSGFFPTQFISLTSSTGVTLYTATTNSSGWLLVNNNSAVYAQNVSGGLTVGVGSAANALNTGTYQGTISLADYYNPTVTLATIQVSLSVNGGSSSGLTITPNPVTLPAAALNGAQVQTTVIVSSVNGGLLSITPSSTGWLNAFSGATGQNLSPGAQASITVTGNPFGLTASTYSGTLSVTIGSLTSSVSVTMVVGSGGGNPTGAVAPTNLNLSFQAGTFPTFVNRPVIAITGPAGSWSSSISYASGSGWLSLSPSAGNLPVDTQATVVPNPGGLSVGNYSATISITTQGGTSTVTVNLAVISGTVLLTTPGSAVFNYSGGSAPAGIQVNPANSDGSALNFTTSANDSWVIVNQQTGSTVFSVQVNPANKSAGVYTSGVTINESGAANNPVTFPVVLVVSGGGSGGSGPLTFTPASMSFSSANGVTPSPLILSVSSNVATSFTVTSSASWLSVTPTSSGTPVNLSVSVNPSSLLPNSTNTGTLSFNSNGSIQTVNVTYVVGSGSGGSGNVTVSCVSSCGTTQPSMAFTAQSPAGSLSGSLSVVSASASAGVSFTAQTSTNGGGAWLSTSAGSSSLTTPVNPLTVTVNAAGLSAGTYTGNIAIVPSGGTTVNVPVSVTITPAASVTASPTSLSFTYRVGDTAPAVQTIDVSGGGSALGFSVTTSPSGTWLSATPASGTTPATGTAQVTVSVNTTNLNPGNYSGTVTIAGTGGANGSTTVNVTLTVTAPLPTVSRVVNGASYQANAISPGEVITLFASDAQHPIGPATPVGLTLDSTGKVATTIGGVQVLINGFACPMIYASATQVSAVVPYEVAPLVAASVIVKFLGQSSNGVTVNIATTSPGIFTLNSSGTGPGAILNQNQSVNSPSNPESRGNTIVVYLTGEGQTSPAGVTGKVTTVASAPPLTPAPLLLVAVTIGGQPANYVYAGEAPGIVSGVMQLNVVIPTTVSAGDLPLVVSVGGVPSQTGVTVSVK